MKRMIGITCFVILAFAALTASAKDVYVDAHHGKDSNPGTLEEPFRTIQKASNAMAEGDVCYIREGIYRETVTPASDGITFKNYENEYVLITGLDIIDDWEPYEKGIMQARSDVKITQVFVDGKRMNWARYPNEDGDMLNLDDLDLVHIPSDLPTGKVSFENMEPRPADFWKGAYFVGLPTERNWWTAHTGRVVSSSGKDIHCEEISGMWERPRFQFTGDGAGYIIGCLNALDTKGEWHWQDNTLYLFPPETAELKTSLIEGRTRIHGFNLTDKKGITLEGLHFKAADIHMPEADNCTIYKCTVRYGGVFSTFYVNSGNQREAWGDHMNGASCIYVGGDNNVVKDCYAGKTWTHGISLWGNGNRLENSIVEHANWMGERFAPVWGPGDDNVIVRNTVRYSMRDGIELGNRGFGIKVAKRALVQYNHVHHCGYLVPDAGLIYANNQGRNPLANTEISYNVLHDFVVDHPGNVGIYLDNNSSGYTLHHNVIWNVVDGIRFRSSTDVFVYNNTIVDVVNSLNIKGQVQEGTYVVVKNNLMTSDVFFGTDKSHNQVIEAGVFADHEGRDYDLKPDVAAINAGTKIDGITVDVAGAPDLGAYEFGKPIWRAGADLVVPDFPDEDRLSTANARLIGHWPLDGNFQDLSANEYHGTVSEQPLEFVPGQHGQAADFRGASIINCGNVPLGTGGQLTVAVWVKPNRIEQPFAGFVQKQNTDYSERAFWMGQHPWDGYFAWAQFTPPTAKGTQLKTTKPVLSNNEWTHVAITMDGTHQRIYVNGILDTISPERISGIMDGGDNLRFGRVENTPGGRYSGLMDDVWIFGEALTGKEIRIIMNGPSKSQLKKLHAK